VACILIVRFLGKSEISKQRIYAAGSIAIGAGTQIRLTLSISFSEPQ
jgi:outer membrane receptor for monomeric catechols